MIIKTTGKPAREELSPQAAESDLFWENTLRPHSQHSGRTPDQVWFDHWLATAIAA